MPPTLRNCGFCGAYRHVALARVAFSTTSFVIVFCPSFLHPSSKENQMKIRFAVATSLAVLATAASAATGIVMHRDPGCGCCEKWAAQVKAAFGRSVRVIDDADRSSFKAANGVPAALSGCHTAVIDGYAFEGHVPIADMKRLLAERPKGTRGLAVTGMPMGSPGMEMAGMAGDHYNVIAFGVGKPTIFARH
jgi:hypothetical protein